MRFEDAARFIKSALLALFGAEIGDEEAHGLASIVVAGSLFVTFSLIAWQMILWVRRRLGDDTALPDDQAAVVRLINRDVQSIRTSIDKFGEQLSVSLGAQIGTLSDTLRSTVANTNDKADEDQEGRGGMRLVIAQRVRDAVLQKFMAGGWFHERPDSRHRFDFTSTTRDGQPFHISLATPYRKMTEEDGRADYVLEVYGSRKLLVFEWDYRGLSPKVVYLSRERTWVEDVVGWSFPVITPSHGSPAIAAE